MTKRKRDSDEVAVASDPPAKRTRSRGKNHFDNLSDELVLRSFSFLPVQDLIRVERVCRRFKRLASDNEIWREKFYNRFVRPRARRIPGLSGLSEQEREKQALYYASKSARWLEHSSRPGLEADWKRRYKVKLNWSQGRCEAYEVALDGPPLPRILAKVFRGTIITASKSGLRTYSQRSRPQLLSAHRWASDKQCPTALATDQRGDDMLAVVGFRDGSFQVHVMNDDGTIETEFTKKSPVEHSVSSIAVSWPYILTMSNNQNIDLYEMRRTSEAENWSSTLLATLHSNAIVSPVSLSIRRTTSTLIASVAYSFTRLNAGWCLGLQEIKLSHAGQLLDSRLTSTVDTPLTNHPLGSLALSRARMTSRSASTGPLPLHPQLMQQPTTLSHSGCYILAGLPDNTLMAYTVTSTNDSLSINGGRRLWGHTSSVSGTEVSERGKALSISAKGDEVRVWELEDILNKFEVATGRTSTQMKPWPSPRWQRDDDNTSIRENTGTTIQAALARRGNGLGLAWQEVKTEMEMDKSGGESGSGSDHGLRHWVGFDDEQVVVLGEKRFRQILSCYDFA